VTTRKLVCVLLKEVSLNNIEHEHIKPYCCAVSIISFESSYWEDVHVMSTLHLIKIIFLKLKSAKVEFGLQNQSTKSVQNQPLWKNNVNLDQEYTVYFGRLCWYNYSIFWYILVFFFLVQMWFSYSIFQYFFSMYF
jgi:hypothetical protein